MARVRDAVGADVLGDAARLACGDARFADGVHERGFAVIDVAHESDDGRAVVQLVGLGFDGLLRFEIDDRGLVDAAADLARFLFKNEAVLRADLAGDLGFDGLIDRGENVHLHQVADDFEGRDAHRGGEILDGEGRLEVDDFFVARRGGGCVLWGSSGDFGGRGRCGRFGYGSLGRFRFEDARNRDVREGFVFQRHRWAGTARGFRVDQ